MLITDDTALAQLLVDTRTIALVGASDNPARDSNKVMRFLLDQGYDVYPVNPVLVGQEIHGRPVFASVASLGMPMDMVDIFRNSDAAAQSVDEAINTGAKAVWMQLGVINEAAAERAVQAGLQVVMNRCPKQEIPRLGMMRHD